MSTPPPFYVDAAGVVLYHGDAREILPTLERVDHVLTDPPYDAKTHDGAGSEYRPIGRERTYTRPLNFGPLDVDHVVPLLLEASARWTIAFCSLEMLGDYKRIAGVESWVRAGVWRRLNGAPQFTGDRPGQAAEGVAIMHRAGVRKRWHGGGLPAYWEYVIERVNRTHATQKPEPLIAALVAAFTDPGELVLDPFAGSGTTLAACKRLGRRAIGIEANVDDCARIAERLRQGALELFDPPGLTARGGCSLLEDE